VQCTATCRMGGGTHVGPPSAHGNESRPCHAHVQLLLPVGSAHKTASGVRHALMPLLLLPVSDKHRLRLGGQSCTHYIAAAPTCCRRRWQSVMHSLHCCCSNLLPPPLAFSHALMLPLLVGQSVGRSVGQSCTLTASSASKQAPHRSSSLTTSRCTAHAAMCRGVLPICSMFMATRHPGCECGAQQQVSG
jgi:hypothetical protein